MPNRAEILKQQFMQSLGLPWQSILPESRLEEILEEENMVTLLRGDSGTDSTGRDGSPLTWEDSL